MSKAMNEAFKDYWRETGCKHDRAYQGHVTTAENAFKAGGDAMIERLKDGLPAVSGDSDAQRSTNTQGQTTRG